MRTENNKDNHQTQEDTTDFGFTQVPRQEKQKFVREVFNSVSENYDLMNDLMSLGIHRLWKKEFIRALGPHPNRSLLDLAGGTGDISFGWLKAGGGPVILSDINESMLRVGVKRAVTAGLIGDLSVLAAGAEALPFADQNFDRVSIAFGLRNCTDKDKVLAEAYRVLKPGGKFFCLEFSKVETPLLSKIYDIWSFEALPRIGAAVAKDRESYQYLAESIRMFPDQETLLGMMKEVGFERAGYRNLSAGIVAIHQGTRL